MFWAQVAQFYSLEDTIRKYWTMLLASNKYLLRIVDTTLHNQNKICRGWSGTFTNELEKFILCRAESKKKVQKQKMDIQSYVPSLYREECLPSTSCSADLL